AILSSAFGSILGGPRVLQALSTDGLAPQAFSKLSRSGQPTVATWVTGAIALVAVALGELNTVARLVSVLFLTLYVAINLSAAIEVLVGEPHFRPKIKVHWFVSILGAFGAVFVMFLISPLACLIAIALEIGIYVWLRRRSLEQQWGDVTSGVWLNIAKRALLNHSRRQKDPRNWRPQILLFTHDLADRIESVKLMAAISQDKGVLTIATLLPLSEQHDFELVEKRRSSMQGILEEQGIEAFCEVSVVADMQKGAVDIAKGHGLAGLKSNTVAQGFSQNPAGRVHQLHSLQSLALSGKSMLIIRHANHIGASRQVLTIWWRGREKNGDLMLLLAYLLQLDPEYRKHKIEIASVVRKEGESQSLQTFIKGRLDEARIQATVRILQSEQSIESVIQKESASSDVVFLGLAVPRAGEEARQAEWMTTVSASLRTSVFVYNAGIGDAVPELLNQV
ncbi:MAG: amino acid permease, partial [Saprospiraceae bacterium]|nr:amino acid permease [Saprospiraceae bacterium]